MCLKTRVVMSALMAFTMAAGAEQFDSSRSYRRCTVTFSGYTGSETLTEFPALVRIPAGSPIYADSVDGSDLRFVDSSGNLVPSEVDNWNPEGESTVWVRVPSLSGTATQLTLYSGGSPAQSARSRELWSEMGYSCVWHFSGSAAESTTNNFVATQSSSAPTYTMPGKVGTAFHGEGSQCFTIANDPGWAGFDVNNFHYSMWMKASAVGYWRALSCKNAYQETAGFECTMQNAENKIMTGGTGTKQFYTTTPTAFTSEFVHFTALYRNGYIDTYVNGVYFGTSSDNTFKVNTPTLALGVGGNAIRASCWKGELDEVRLGSGLPSAAWIAADYEAQSKQDFAVLGELEDLAAAKADVSSCAYKVDIALAGHAGNTVLNDFPVLVRIPATSGIAAKCQNDGADIRITDANGFTLDHEIDNWNPCGESTLWVRIPRYTSASTTLHLYFGAAAYVNANARRVWGPAGYKGVWHFSGSNADSSPNDLQGEDTSTKPNFDWAGPVGTAFHGAGSSSFAIPNAPSWAGYDGRAFTLSGWVRLTPETASASCYRIFCAKKVFNEETGFELTTQNAPDVINTIGRNSTQTTKQLPEPFTNKFAYITSVFDNGALRFYANGVQIATKASGYDILCATNVLRIGGQTVSVGFKGELDELRMQWNTQSADWVAADFASQNGSGLATLGAVTRVDGESRKFSSEKFHRVCAVTFPGYTGETLYEFPALVRIPAGSSVLAEAADGGADIRFTDADGYEIPHEIDTWNAAGESLVWVRVPQLGGAETKVYMYYRNRHPEPAIDSGEVWRPAGYRGVWHFSGSGADSSSFALTSQDSSTRPSYAGVGVVGTAFSSAETSYVNIPNDANWAAYGYHPVTFSGWVKADTAKDPSTWRIFSAKKDHTHAYGFEITLQKEWNKFNVIAPRIENRNANGFQFNFTTEVGCNDQFLYLTVVMGERMVKFYANGELVEARDCTFFPVDATEMLRIGAQGGGGNKWPGRLDEVRFSWNQPSAAWVKADYDTQHNLAFSALGVVEEINLKGTCILLR